MIHPKNITCLTKFIVREFCQISHILGKDHYNHYFNGQLSGHNCKYGLSRISIQSDLTFMPSGYRCTRVKWRLTSLCPPKLASKHFTSKSFFFSLSFFSLRIAKNDSFYILALIQRSDQTSD